MSSRRHNRPIAWFVYVSCKAVTQLLYAVSAKNGTCTLYLMTQTVTWWNYNRQFLCVLVEDQGRDTPVSDVVAALQANVERFAVDRPADGADSDAPVCRTNAVVESHFKSVKLSLIHI